MYDGDMLCCGASGNLGYGKVTRRLMGASKKIDWIFASSVELPDTQFAGTAPCSFYSFPDSAAPGSPMSFR